MEKEATFNSESSTPPNHSDVHGLAWSRFPLRSEITVSGEEGVWEVQSIFQDESDHLVITATHKVHPDHPLEEPKTFLASDCHPV